MTQAAKYRIRNWKQYNRALTQRGSITLWLSPEMLKKWKAPKKKKQGRPFVYSDDAILCALMIKAVYHLPFRQLRGLLLNLANWIGGDLPIPCYTRICRRARALGQKVERLSCKRPVDLVFDSTGLKVFGEGEWKVKKHGADKRRTWRKLHLSICPHTQEIHLAELTGNEVTDSQAFSNIGQKIPSSVERVFGDGAYDKQECYRLLYEKGIEPIIVPQKNGVAHEELPHLKKRNRAIKELRGFGGDEKGRRLWKKLKGYHLRSLVETAMFRFKALFGGHLRCKILQSQKAEIYSKCLAINIMNKLGMPKGRWVFS